MKSLYLLAAIMFTGLLMMTVSSYKVISVVKDSPEAASPAGAHGKSPAPAVNPDVLPYVTLSYVGLTLFLVGAVGAIIAAFRAMTNRF